MCACCSDNLPQIQVSSLFPIPWLQMADVCVCVYVCVCVCVCCLCVCVLWYMTEFDVKQGYYTRQIRLWLQDGLSWLSPACTMWPSDHEDCCSKDQATPSSTPLPSLPQAWQWAVYEVTFTGPGKRVVSVTMVMATPKTHMGKHIWKTNTPETWNTWFSKYWTQTTCTT